MPARIRGGFRRFFDQPEQGFTVHFVAYLAAAVLIQIVLWAGVLVGLYLAWELWIRVTQLIYSSPENYLLYSVIPVLGICFLFGVGQVLWESLSDNMPRWRRRWEARRKRRRDGDGG
ncbi:MAG: hypothetical protein JJE10_06425 [Thermoleophilia bacterium]|nr:hypothetical protein [Thermoleophilia bacterium]